MALFDNLQHKIGAPLRAVAVYRESEYEVLRAPDRRVFSDLAHGNDPLWPSTTGTGSLVGLSRAVVSSLIGGAVPDRRGAPLISADVKAGWTVPTLIRCSRQRQWCFRLRRSES